MPHVETGRKRICGGGAEVITSGEVSGRMKETVSKNVKGRNRQEKRKTKTTENDQERRLEW